MIYFIAIFLIVLYVLHHFYRRSTEHRRLAKKRNSELENILLDQIFYQPVPPNFPTNKEEQIVALQVAMWDAMDDFEKACKSAYDIITPMAKVIKHAYHLRMLQSLSEEEITERLKLVKKTGRIFKQL